ncbi:hypothetical protein [Actinopolymorpha alba]|nr:hypothetical protein [Actinopolymorpha alba]
MTSGPVYRVGVGGGFAVLARAVVEVVVMVAPAVPAPVNPFAIF